MYRRVRSRDAGENETRSELRGARQRRVFTKGGSRGLNEVLFTVGVVVALCIAAMLLGLACVRWDLDAVRSASLKGGPPLPPLDVVVIAANYFNNEDVLPAHSEQVERLCGELLRQGIKVYLSFYESGSLDATPELLKSFEEKLGRIPTLRHSIRAQGTEGTEMNWREVLKLKLEEDPEAEIDESPVRIEFMANVRNKALEPLFNRSWFDIDGDDVLQRSRLLFLNDVYFMAQDALELLRTNDGQYDAACGLDFNHITFYDTWVTRSYTGEMLLSIYPYFQDRASQLLLRRNQPIPVYSCWNGMVSLPLAPFVSQELRFRTWQNDEPRSPHEEGALDEVYSSKTKQDDELSCMTSECTLLFKDMWLLNFTEIYINPLVRTTYSMEDWLLLRYIGPLYDFYSDNFVTYDSTRIEEPDRSFQPGHRKHPPRSIKCGFVATTYPTTLSYLIQIVMIFGVILLVMKLVRMKHRYAPWIKRVHRRIFEDMQRSQRYTKRQDYSFV